MIIARAVRNFIRRRPRWIEESKHGIFPSQIESCAAETVGELQKAGYEAHIVGGAVRDLLLGIAPKDFDVSTSATPHEVRKIFRASRIIGRRFQIVHVYRRRGDWRNFVEVATFRADGGETARNEHGRILADNVFGTAAEDAARRDFTCNALFYNPENGRIADYLGGYEDIRRRRLTMIGDPATRFRQDPVRMLRALRLECKLGLSPGRPILRALNECAGLLADISPSRLFDETAKIINSGAATSIFRRCAECGIAEHALPNAAEDEFAQKVLAATDARRAGGGEVSLSFVMAGLFWQPLCEKWRGLCGENVPPVRAMERALAEFPISDNVIPRRVVARMMDIYFLQARMETRRIARRAAALLHHPQFARAVAFAALRTDQGAAEIANWWRDYHRADSAGRRALVAKDK